MNRISLGGAPNNLMFNKKINKMKGKIFNTEEVQAIIAGNKTMFREVVKEIGNIKLNSGGAGLYFGKCPYQVGQKIFCKESFFINSFNERMFKATFDYCSKRFSRLKDLYHDKSAKWKPAQHMKQEHSRLTLLIKEIRVERLADISEEDCIKEGIEKMWLEENEDFPRYTFGKHSFFEVKKVFRDWWNATHKKPEEKFEANPWVWVVSFEVINN